jgi:hypothetical protein
LDVIPEGFIRLLDASLQVMLGVGLLVGAMEIADEDSLEVGPTEALFGS